MKKACIIKGSRVYLKSFLLSDVSERVFEWMRDNEVVKYIESEPPGSLKELRLFYSKIIKSNTNSMFAIFTKDKNVHIGNVKLGNINFKYKFADLGIVIGKKEYWGKGYCQESVRLLLKHAFKTLKLHKIFLSVNAENEAAISAYLRVGFKIEGRLREFYYYKGRYIDRIYMGILKNELC